MPLRVGVVYGTRPEAIKVAPSALALDADDGFELVLISTGQHREVVHDVGELVGTDPELITSEVTRLLGDPVAYEAMRRPGITCYGDGKAAQRCLDVLREIRKETA